MLTALTAAFHAFGGSHNAGFASPSFPDDGSDHRQVSRWIIRRLEIINLDFEIIIGREKNELFGVSDDMFLKV